MEGTQCENSTLFFSSLTHLPHRNFVVDRVLLLLLLLLFLTQEEDKLIISHRKLWLKFLYLAPIQLVELSNKDILYPFISTCLMSLKIRNIAICHELALCSGNPYILIKNYFMLFWKLCFLALLFLIQVYSGRHNIF